MRLLRKMDEIERSAAWQARPVFGGAVGSFEGYAKLNLGVFGRESRFMCSHIRPPASRLAAGASPPPPPPSRR